MNFILDIVEDKSSELEDSSKESTQNAARRNKEIKNKRKQFKGQENSLRDPEICPIGLAEEKNKENVREVTLKI